jgi:hypothetical protein
MNVSFLSEMYGFIADKINIHLSLCISKNENGQLLSNKNETLLKLYHFMYDDATIWLHRKKNKFDCYASSINPP